MNVLTTTRTAITLLLLAVGRIHAQAQSPLQTPVGSVRLTLDDALARGVASSRRLEEATARHEASAAVVGQRHAASRPQVSAQAGYARTNHVDEFGILMPNNQLRVIYPDVPDNYRTRLDLAWPLYTGGRLESFERAAERESAATADDAEALKADIRLEVARAFWALVVADESQRVVNESLARTSAHLRNASDALDAGLVPPNEVLTAQAQESRQRMLSIQARSARDVAEADLARLVGAAPGAAIQPEANLLVPVTTGDAAALVAKAMEQRRDRRAIVDRLSAVGLRGEAAAGARRPSVAVGGGVDYARPNPRIFPRQEAWKPSWDAGVNVNWLLLDGGRAKAEAAEAAAGKRALEARLAEFDAVVAVEIRQRLSEIEASRAAITAAEDGVRAATEALRVVNDRFAAGVAISTDVLDAQVMVLQASLDRTQAMVTERLAGARLRRALGE